MLKTILSFARKIADKILDEFLLEFLLLLILFFVILSYSSLKSFQKSLDSVEVGSKVARLLEYIGQYECTGYSAVEKWTDQTPFLTSRGLPVHTSLIAASQDLLEEKIISYGDILYIKELDRLAIVGDTMNKRIKKRFDLFFWSQQEAKDFGLKKLTFYRLKWK